MANRLLKTASTQYVPAVEEVIARPAYCVTTAVSRPVTRYARDVSTTTYSNGITVTTTAYYPVTRYETLPITVCYDAVEAVEGQDAYVLTDNRIGWNSGGRSIAGVAGDLISTFSFSDTGMGMICGLADPSADVTTFAAVTHGLQATIGATVRVFESGVEVANSGKLVTAVSTVQIQRTGGVVTYRVDDWEYTSATLSEGDVSLLGNLYYAGDYIEDPALNATVSIAADAYWGWPDWLENTSVGARVDWGWSVTATVGDGVASLPFSVGVASGDYDYAVAVLDVVDLELVSETGAPVVDLSNATLSIPSNMFAFVIDVDRVDVYADVEVGMLAGDYDYSFADLTLDGMAVTAFAFDEAPNSGNASNLVLALDNYFTDPVVYAALSESLTVGDTFAVMIAVDAALADMLFAGDAVSATQVLTALLESGITFSDNASNVQAAVVQYVTNLANGAVGRYEGYDFQGFCRGTDASFGWKRDGLYRLGEQTDDGETISALLDFAAQDFGATASKRLKAIYFGLDTDGAMYAKLTNDREKDVVFRVQPYGTQARMQAQRGESSRYWRLQLQIIDATFAEIDGIEWVAGSTGRRITR